MAENEKVVEEKAEETVKENIENEEVIEKEPEIDKDKYIPKDVALEWKRNSKELKKELRKLREKEFARENQSRLDKIRSRAKEKGLDDDMAEMFGDIAGELISLIPKHDSEESELFEDFNDFIEEYPEAKQYKKDILDKVKLYRKADPDFTLESAYRLISPGKSSKEMQLEAEQKAAIARREGNKEPALTTSSPSGDKYFLTDDEKRVVKKLQEADPGKNWTNKKYYETVVKPKRDMETKIR